MHIRTKVILLLISLVFSMTSCYRSKDGPPRRFIKKGHSLKLYIIDKQHIERVLKSDANIYLDISRAKRDSRYDTVIAVYDFSKEQYELENWDWSRQQKLLERVWGINQLLADDLMSEFKRNIHLYPYEDDRMPMGTYAKYPIIEIDIEYIGSKEKVIEIISSYYEVVAVY